MRAPIASVLGIINLTNSTAKTMEEASELRMLAKQQIEKLDSILSSLIRTQKIQIAEKDSDRIVIAEIIDEVFSSLQYTKGFNEISFEKNIDDIQDFYSDKQLLISVLLNLIDNAIKYKKENFKNSYIKISVTKFDLGIKIFIEDNGIGINEDAQKGVFDMFFRATNHSSGSGLGLYTVRHTVKKLSGEIELESKEGLWTKFTIFIPNAKA